MTILGSEPTLSGFDSDRSRRCAVVRGGWDGHQPVETTDLFIGFLQANGFAVDVHDSPVAYADAAYLADVDLIVQCVTMSTITPDECAGLRAAVETGTGFAGWHGGIVDSFRETSDYLQLVGGQFAAHPHAPVSYTVNLQPAAADHPITEGLTDFDLTTEQYWVLA